MFKIGIFHYAYLFSITYGKVTQHSSEAPSKVDIRQILQNEGVIPLLINDVPNKLCTVIYQNETIIPGQRLKGPVTAKPPNVTWDADNNSYYLLFLSGLTRWLPFHPTVFPHEEDVYPMHIEWENWIVINIPGCNVSAGDTLADYIYPGYPIRDNMKEKFTFLVYKQEYKYNYHKLRDNLDAAFPKEITLRNFVKMYKLNKPVAVNYFYSEWDESFRITMSSLRWERLVLYNGSTTTPYPPYNTSDWPQIDFQKFIKKYGWENFTLPPTE